MVGDDRSRRSRSRKRPVSSHDFGLRDQEMGEVRENDDSVPVSFAHEPSGEAKARKGSLWSVVQLQWWMSSALRIRNYIAPYGNKVLGVILIRLLLSILGWAYIATHSNVVKALAMDTKGCSSPCSIGLSGCFNGVCTIDKINNLSFSMPTASEDMKSDPILEPKHKIFLSHSGAQKEFVEHLCEALEDRFHYPFFDRRHESLPKGEQFPNLIVEAAKQCEMLIVVVSDEYFMSKWPMIELNAFVKAHKFHHESKDSTKGPKILPLFYGLSADDLKDATMQKKWIQKWETLAKGDQKKQIVVDDWKYALNVLRSFNGLLYDKSSKEIVAYMKKIVSHVCKSIRPSIRWEDSHVQGKSNILKVIGEKIEGIEVSKKYNIKVVGIYGIGGIGKTTLCKMLCNELSNEYEGRVCHIEFPNVLWSDSKEFLQKVLQDLTRKSMNVIQHLNEGECKDSLHKNLFKQKTFLAIDNVWDHYKVYDLAKVLLKLPYHPDSLVVVMARSQSILKHLGISRDAYFEMPDLEEADALKLFLYHANGGKEIFGDEEKHHTLTCIRRCYFSKGDGQGHHYHPLALQVLGLQLNDYEENPSLWVKNLPPMKTLNSLSGGNPVFDILKSSFDLLSSREQIFFMDVGYFSFRTSFGEKLHSQWVFDMYKQDVEGISQQIERLKRKGLLVDVDLRSQIISMHDLYHEFFLLEAKGSFNELELGERKWLSIKDGDFIELVSERAPRYWHKLKRLNINYPCMIPRIRPRGLEDIKWDYFSNLEVLQLCDLHVRHGALKLEGLERLKNLDLVHGYIDGIEGLEKLKHLTHFTLVLSPHTKQKFRMELFNLDIDAHIKGQIPSSLEYLKIYEAVLRSDLLARCYHLSNLKLVEVVAHLLNLSGCQSLEKVYLWNIEKLQTLSGLATSRPPNLKSLDVLFCKNLVDIPGLDHLPSLKSVYIVDCPKFKVPSLNGNNQLESLTLNGIDGLTSLVELGDLPALQSLNLGNCKHLMQLPDLSKSRNLRTLNLQGCFALQLHEREIQMLSALPLLEPLSFYDNYGILKIKLDLHQRKLLMYQNPNGSSIMEDEWEKRDLNLHPIEIRKLLDPSFFEKEYMFHLFKFVPKDMQSNSYFY